MIITPQKNRKNASAFRLEGFFYFCKAEIKKGASLIYRTATTTYPCCGQALGEFGGSWSYMTYPATKVEHFFE